MDGSGEEHESTLAFPGFYCFMYWCLTSLQSLRGREPPRVLTRRLPPTKVSVKYDIDIVSVLLCRCVYLPFLTKWFNLCRSKASCTGSRLWSRQQREFKPQYHICSFHWQWCVLLCCSRVMCVVYHVSFLFKAHIPLLGDQVFVVLL